MPILLTDEQLQQLDNGQSVAITDSIGQKSYVVLRKDMYDEIQQMVDDLDPRIMKRHLARMMADDWTAPEMDVYS